MNRFHLRVKLNEMVAIDSTELPFIANPQIQIYLRYIADELERMWRLKPVIIENCESIEIIIKTKKEVTNGTKKGYKDEK